MNDRRVDKEKREVLFTLTDGSTLEGEVFLRLYEAHHSGPQRVSELLNDEEDPFIPVRTVEGVVLLNVRHIMLAEISAEPEVNELMTLGDKFSVKIKTVHSKDIEADVFVCLQNGGGRVKDYFNQPTKFLRLFQQKSIIYINQKFILTVQD